MGHVDGRDADLVMKVLDLCARRDAQLRVEVRERLVHEKDRRLAHDRASQCYALPLPAGQFAGTPMKEVAELNHRRGSPDAGVVRRRVDPADLQWEADVLVNREVWIQAIVLEYHGDVAVLRLEIVDNPIADPDLAFGRVLEARDHPHGRGLSAARWAEEDDELPIGDLQVEVAHAGERSPPFRHPAKPNLRHGTALFLASTHSRRRP